MSEAIRAITMPKWGLAMEEGQVIAWHVEEGAEIKAGDELVDIETSKITNVYESPVGGILRRRVVAEGETLPVGALIGVVSDAGLPDAEVDAFVERFNAAFAEKLAARAEAGGPAPQTVSAEGRQINYLEMGAGDGPPLLLIHGFGGDLNNWLFNQPALAESQRVIALDLPGHGRSSKEIGGGGLDELSRTLGAFLDALAIERAHLAGHSMGGALALLYALQRPERVASLSLLAPAGLGPDVNMDFIEGFIGAGRRKEMKAVLQLLVADPELVSRDMVEDVLKFKRLDGVEPALRRLADSLFPGGRQQTIPAEELGRLAVPALVIWGRLDQILPPTQSELLPEGVALHLLEGIGHMPHMEAANEVNRLIAAQVA